MKSISKRIQQSALLGLVTVLLPLFSFAVDYDGKKNPGTSNEMPQQLQGVGIDQKMGTFLDLTMSFKNEKGEAVPLSSYFDGKTPVIISPVYFSCPGLCNFHLNGLTDALKEMDWTIGGKFKVLSVSFDAKEDSVLAQKKKETYLKVYGRGGVETENGWHFLTADQETVNKFTQALGFKFQWDEANKEWAHASAAIVVSPKGEITRYLPGIMFDQKDIKLALNEASAGKIGSFVDSLVLYCFKYDTHQSKYTLYAFNLVKMGGALMVLLLSLWLLPVWFRARRES